MFLASLKSVYSLDSHPVTKDIHFFKSFSLKILVRLYWIKCWIFQLVSKLERKKYLVNKRIVLLYFHSGRKLRSS